MRTARSCLLMVVFIIFPFWSVINAQSSLEKDSRQNIRNYGNSIAPVISRAVMTDQWNNIGPKGMVTNAMVVDPSNSSKIFAGSIAGLFVTTNGGTSWSIVNSTFYNKNIYSLEMHPTDHNIILASVWDNSLGSAYIYRSSDNGSTWQSVQTMYDLNNGKIVFAKSNPSVVYVEGYYLYKSTDAGATWTEITTLYDINIFDVYKGDSNKLYLQLYGRDFYKSDDGGSTFTWISSLSNRFAEITVSPSSSTTVYAGSNERSSTGGYGFFSSTDGGVSWSSVKTGFGQISKISFITFHPDYNNIVYAGGSGSSLMKSTDSGVNWTDIMTSVSDNYVYGVQFDTQRNIYAFTGANIYKSSDQSTWQAITSTQSNQDVFKIEINPGNLKIFYAATLGGIYKTTDGGANWVEKNTGITDTDIWALAISPIDYNTLFAGTFGGLVYRTTDGGANWVEKSTGLTGLAGSDIWELWCHPLTAGIVFALEDGNRIFRSTDNGDSWAEYTVGGSSITSLDISSTSKNIWYARTSSGSIYYSSDYGANWTYKGVISSLYNMAVDSGNPNTLYGNQYSSYYYNIVRSTDGGVNWTTQYYSMYVRDLFSMPISPYALYATTWYGSGVVTSTDGGVNWTSLLTGLTYFSCFEFQNLPGYSNYFFVTTYGGSIYGYNYTPTGVEKDNNSLPSDYYLAQNYPNPFNPSTTISFSIPKTGNVSLKVFDMLGREVADLVNENMAAGNYKVNFNAQNLASGVYLYSLTCGNIVKTNKMNLAK